MKKYRVFKARDLRKLGDVPFVDDCNISIAEVPIFAGVNWGDEFLSENGVMRLAYIRDITMDTDHRLATDNVQLFVGSAFRSNLYFVDGRFYICGVDFNNAVYYRKIGGVGFYALYEISVSPAIKAAAEAATLVVFKRYGFV